jgi:hypothetical protein
VLARLRADGATVLATTTLVDSVTAVVSPAEARALAVSPYLAMVVPDGLLPAPGAPTAPAKTATARRPASVTKRLPAHHVAPARELCGTRSRPEVDPQALGEIHAGQARAMGADGAGVTVAVLADGLNPDNADFVRNRAYGRAGTPVITRYLDFSGDGPAAMTVGAEAFGDASSVAAQGNKVYNLARYVNPELSSVLPKGGCWVKIVGAAPGASLLALKAVGENSDLTGVVQAVQYAVQHGAKVITESLGSEEFPDTAMDIFREADDAAVAAGVTVVVASGDGGPTSTIASPGSDPNVISVGATTTFRLYAQVDEGGFYNPVVGNGTWASNNMASFSSGGYDQSGGTVDLVAPGDANWALCSTDTSVYIGCADTLGGRDVGVEMFGGTSEAAPLTAAAAADVIQAYSHAHRGADPSPALVKQILCSTAADIGAPAAEQGAGLLNIAGAVALAESLPAPPPPTTTTTTTPSTSTTATPVTTTSTTPTTTTGTPTTSTTTLSTQTLSTQTLSTQTLSTQTLSTQTASTKRPAAPAGRLLVGPDQVNVVGQPGATSAQRLSFTNTGPAATTVRLSTRALTVKIYDTGARKFTIDPRRHTAKTGTFPTWDGTTAVYRTKTFDVPASSGSRLVFSATYKDTGQSSPLRFALFEPNGTYAGYSRPQGIADYGEVEVADPPAGKWTALFFTDQNSARTSTTGTSGTVHWDASTWRYARAATMSPPSLTIAPGRTATATMTLTDPRSAGDSNESVVVSSADGQTTVPVTVRTMVPVSATGGTFKGVLTGGNGRFGSDAQTNTYFFRAPAGERDLDASVTLRNDPGELLVGYLVAPDGQTLGSSSNYTAETVGSRLVRRISRYLQMYNLEPQAGQWELVLQWDNPVTGNELAEPFSGAVRFDQVRTSSALPTSTSRTLVKGRTASFEIHLVNTGVAPGAYFADPRLDQTTTVELPDLDGNMQVLQLPLSLVPLYMVPTGTTQLTATASTLTGTEPATLDLLRVIGDPNISSGTAMAGTSASRTGTSESVSLSEPEVSQGIWGVQLMERGPFSSGGEPKELVALKVAVTTRAIDPAVRPGTFDLWQLAFSTSAENIASPKVDYVAPGRSLTLNVEITPTAAVGTQVSGTLYIDDLTFATSAIGLMLPNADEVAALPYSYTVAAP